MKSELPPLSDPFEFTVLAQSGLFHYLVGFHNRWFDFAPRYGWVVTPNSVLPIPFDLPDELFRTSGVTGAIWGPVCTPTIANIAIRNFELWVRESILADDDDDEDVMALAEMLLAEEDED